MLDAYLLLACSTPIVFWLVGSSIVTNFSLRFTLGTYNKVLFAIVLLMLQELLDDGARDEANVYLWV